MSSLSWELTWLSIRLFVFWNFLSVLRTRLPDMKDIWVSVVYWPEMETSHTSQNSENKIWDLDLRNAASWLLWMPKINSLLFGTRQPLILTTLNDFCLTLSLKYLVIYRLIIEIKILQNHLCKLTLMFASWLGPWIPFYWIPVVYWSTGKML